MTAEQLLRLASDPALRVRSADSVRVYDFAALRWLSFHLAEVSPAAVTQRGETPAR